ncbi:MAG: o-succinylbenzoate synthase [Microbacteriaceae bacterium]|nr:o-succinylbenzoate synthase [Microbacteriaceae bacterium]
MKSLPQLNELLESAKFVRLPLRNRFRGLDSREAVLFEGPNGWTEFSPFDDYSIDQATRWLKASLEYGWGETPEPTIPNVPVNATIPGNLNPEKIDAVLAKFTGVQAVKIKVGGDSSHSADLEVIRYVRSQLGENVRIRVDLNAFLDLDTATDIVPEYVEAGVDDYVEQPVASVPALAELRRRLAGVVRIAADESVRRSADAYQVLLAEAADVLVLKWQPLGGFEECQRIARAAAKSGVSVTVSSALETAVGLAAGARLAASIDSETPTPGGLGTSALFVSDISEAVLPNAGVVSTARVIPEEAALEEFSAPDIRTKWRRRISACYRKLEV